MLTVHNGWMKNSISQERITRVVNSAKLNATTVVQDDSRYMGPIDSFIDHYFFNDTKRLALDILYELSSNTTLLNIESGKSEGQIQRDKIDQYRRKIEDCQKQFRELIPGRSIEFGRSTTRPDEGGSCFLIYRDENILTPVGIPLYQHSASSTANTQSNERARLQTFLKLDDIQPDDLNQIKKSGQLLLNDQIYEVRFTHENEPVLMCYETSTENSLIQTRLSNLWISQLAQQEHIRLAEIEKENSALKLNAVFLGLGHGEERSYDEISAAQTWKENSQVIQTSFDTAIGVMQGILDTEQAKLSTEVARISEIPFPTIAEKKALLHIQAEIENLIVKQSKLNKNIERLKSEFTALCHLIGYCSDLEMIQIFTLRTTNFLDFIVRYSEGPMGHAELAEFNTMLNTQSELLKNFGPEEVANCTNLFDPLESDRTWEYGIEPPTSDRLRNELRQLLTDPSRSWDDIDTAMKRLKVEQEFLLIRKIKQIEFGNYLQELIDERITKDPSGKFACGLNKESGLTYFTPETYSRIVSLLNIRDELLDSDKNFTDEEIETMGATVSVHAKKIAAENLAYLEKRKQSYFSSMVTTYNPTLNEDGVPIDHDGWARQFGIESFRAKSGAIIAQMREVHKITQTNIDTLIKRGETINTVAPKTVQFHENTKAFKKSSTQLKKAM